MFLFKIVLKCSAQISLPLLLKLTKDKKKKKKRKKPNIVMRMTRNRFPLVWRVLFNMKVFLTRVDRGSLRFDLNFMYMTYFIFPFSHKFQPRPLVCKKNTKPSLAASKIPQEFELAFYLLLVGDIFLSLSLQCLQVLCRGLIPLRPVYPRQAAGTLLFHSARTLTCLCTNLGQSQNWFQTQIL